MTTELYRLGIVYAHLLCCCVALGLILASDFEMVRRLYEDTHNKPVHRNHLSRLQTTVTWVLGGLWATGIAICFLDYQTKGFEIFLNPKLQVKIFMVVLLTMNGFVLHKYILPMFTKYGSLHHFEHSDRVKACFFGAISGTTWLYAAFLGIARPFNWKYSFLELVWPYPFIVAASFAAMLFIIEHSRKTS